ncbi:MAG: hypothetical protein JNL83_15110 [Myxococcales bacterium]|nr:hypothetical protein [Myxococcales bacterium]
MRPVCLALALALASTTASARRPVVPLPQPIPITPLAWSMNVETAQAVLEAKQMAPRYDETRRYMAITKDQPYVRHTSEPGLSYVPRAGWRGYAHFAWREAVGEYRPDRVVHHVVGLTDAQLADELAALASTYGAPHEQGDNHRVWQRGGTRLCAGFTRDEDTKRWTLYLGYSLAP